jgi:hypothetical protein
MPLYVIASEAPHVPKERSVFIFMAKCSQRRFIFEMLALEEEVTAFLRNVSTHSSSDMGVTPQN